MAAMASADSLGPGRTGAGAGRPPPGRRGRAVSGPAADAPIDWEDGDPADELLSSFAIVARRLARADPEADARMDGATRLAQGVAHEFNNILAAVLGNLQLLRRRAGEDPAVRGMVDPAIYAALRGSDLTKRLLAYAYRREPDPELIDINALVAAMADAIARTAGPDIKASSHLAEGVPTVECDPLHLQSAILSLAANARDAMPEGGALTVETAKIVVDGMAAARPSAVMAGAYACVSVSDTGCGMTADLVERAFDPFFSTKEGHGRCGLGLSLVSGFVRQAGGHVTVGTAPGRGTRFRIFLPAVERLARRDSEQGEAAP